MGKTLVVDACVVTSASEKDAPISTMCRSILDILMATDNRIGLNAQLQQEWLDHKSLYTTKVLSFLKSRKRILYLNENNLEVVEIRENLDKIINKSRIEPISKDLHLIDIALSTDLSIISRDNKARNHFCSVLNLFPTLEKILWVNPVDPNDDSLKWLASGANFDERKTLKAYVPT